MKNKQERIDHLVELLNEYMNKEIELKNPYIVGYYRTKDDKLIGYHLSTSCQLTDEIMDGKRYDGDNPYRQLETISKNLKYTLESSEESPGFMGFANATREQYFEGYQHGDIYLQAIYLTEGTPRKPIIYTYK